MNDVPLHFSEAFRVLRHGGVVAVETSRKWLKSDDIFLFGGKT